MAAPAFGFSVGDFIAGGQILIEVIRAFKESGGASSKYASEISFLNSLKATLDHLERFVGSTSSSQSKDLPDEISKLLQQIREPWNKFKKYLDKYEPSLGASSCRSKIAKVPRTIQYTVKDISGNVEKLRLQTEQPLQAVNSLLSLYVIKSLEKLPEQIFQPAQCAQLVEAITLAGIPTELDKQIRELKQAADEHNVKQDDQLQIITTLRAQLEERISGLQSVLDEIKGPDPIAKEQHDKQLDASLAVHTRVDQLAEVFQTRADQLESAMKEQKELVLALKSFLEDKTSKSEGALESGDRISKDGGSQNSWPSSTLSTAYFAALLLSSVLSSVAVNSIVAKRRIVVGTVRPVFVPEDYSLPGLGTLNKEIQIQPSLMKPIPDIGISPSPEEVTASNQDQYGTSTENIVASTETESGDTATTKVSEWLQDYSRTQRAVRQPTEQAYIRTYVNKGNGYSMGPDWSRGISKLDNSESGDDGLDGDHGIGSDGGEVGDGGGMNDGGLPEGLGPVDPSSGDGGFDWGDSFDWGADGIGGGGDPDSDSDSDSDSS